MNYLNTFDKLIAWMAPFLCIILTNRFATTFVVRSPRLFSVLALFSCTWALLAAFYSGVRSELLPAFSGFLGIYMGGLMWLEAKRREAEDKEIQVVWLQRTGLWLLYVIAAPGVIGIDLGTMGLPVNFQNWLTINRVHSEIIIGTVLTLAGYASIGYGSHLLFRRIPAMAVTLIVLLSVYGLFEVTYDFVMWDRPSDIPAWLNYIFAIAKVIFTIVLAGSIAYEGMSDPDRRRGWCHWLLCFLGIRNPSW